MPGYKVIAAEGLKTGLVCPECDLVLKEAVQTPEGIRLCESCYQDISKLPNYKSQKTGLSVIGDDGKPFCFPDKAVRRDVQQLEVQCDNWKAGCKWVGQLGSYLKIHELECLFKPEPCSDCGEMIYRDKMDKHHRDECRFRKDQCEYCGKKLIHHKMQEHHKSCKKYPLRCEHCQDEVPRQNMKHHIDEECRHVKCSCGEVLNRHTSEEDPKSVLTHLKNPAILLTHLISLFTMGQTIMDNMKQMDLRLTAIENGSVPVNSLQTTEELSRFRKDIDRKFRDFTDRLTPLQQAHLSSNSSDKNMTSKVQELTSKLVALEQKSTRQELEISTLKAQLERQSLSSSWNQPTSTSRNYSSSELQRLSHLERKYEDIERQVTMLKVHVSEMELQLQASLASTYNGSFMWRIPDLSKRKRDAIDGRVTSLYSPPFYTAKNGYKMCVRVYLNGDGMGHKTHLSLFFVLMKGEFDALLKWPFENKVSLILVDQNHRKHIVQTFKPTPESSSFQRPISDMNVASGCPQFCKLSFLDDDNYTKDDVLFVKCIVDTSRIFHP